MRMKGGILLGGVLAAGAAAAQGGGREQVISDPAAAQWSFEGNARTATVNGAPVPGGAAIRVTIARKGANPWDVQARLPLAAAVAAGDRVTFGFYARTTQPDPGGDVARVNVRLQRNAAPYDAALEGTVEIGREWRFHCLSGPATIALAPPELVASVQLAGERHVVEFGPYMATRIPAANAATPSGLPCGEAPAPAGG